MRAKEFIIETFSDSRLRNLPGGNRNRSVSGPGLSKGDLVKITPKGIKVFGSMQHLGVGDWVEVRDTGYQQKITQITKGSARLEDGKFYSLNKLRYPLDESINEGGWEDTITHKTKLTPPVIKAALLIVEKFTSDFNKFLYAQGHDPIKMGNPLGSSAYHNVDDPDTEYGDIDMQMIAPGGDDKSPVQLSKQYNELVDQFLSSAKPGYYYDRGKPNNGHPIFKIGDDAYVQVDLLWTIERLSKWDRWRKTPMRGIKGLIMGNLYSTLGEVINMSLQSAVLMKIKDGEPINYQRGRNPDEVVEVSSDIENFGTDILKYVYNAVNGSLDGIQIDPLLKANPGLKTGDVQIVDIVRTVKGLAKSFELNDLYGKHVLKDYNNAEELLAKYQQHYFKKADLAGKGSKLDKAKTPEELAKVQELRNKIAKGVALVKKAFAEE